MRKVARDKLDDLETRVNELRSDVDALSQTVRKLPHGVQFPSHTPANGMRNCRANIRVNHSNGQFQWAYCRKAKGHEWDHMTIVDGAEIEWQSDIR